MIKNNKISFIIIFCIQTLSLFGLINSISIYVLEEAKEIPSSKNNILSFIIKSGINEAINNDKYFKIDSEIYDNSEILKKSQIECTIPKEPNADFGTRIDIKCEIDLESTSNANKIKFLEFIPDNNDRDLSIIDKNKKILDQYLSFEKKEKKADLKPDYKFVAETIKSSECKENVLNFEIKGEIDKFFIKGFQFNITWNDNFPFEAQCICPDIYLSSETTIKCSLEIKNNENFIYNLNKGIQLKQKVYEEKEKDNKMKVVKISIKDNKPELVLNELNCDFGSYRNDMDYNRKSNRGSQYEQPESGKNQEEINKEEESQKKWEREKEEEKRRKKEEEDREKEDERRRKEQQDYEKYMREREREKEEEERRRRKEQEDEQRQREDGDRRNKNNNYYNNYNNRNDFRGKRNYDNENDNNNNYNI